MKHYHKWKHNLIYILIEVIFDVFSEKTEKTGIDKFMSDSEENLEAPFTLWFQTYIKLLERIHDFV